MQTSLPLHTWLSSFGLPDQDIRVLLDTVEKRSLRRNEFLLREGDQAQSVAFIQSGIFRSYYLSDTDEDITYCFRFPGQLITAYSSFITGKPSVEFIQASQSAEVLLLPKPVLQKLMENSLPWQQFARVMAEQQFLELEQILFRLQKSRARERYAELLHREPDFIREIPLQHLASYLGVTPRHLTRIRKEFY